MRLIVSLLIYCFITQVSAQDGFERKINLQGIQKVEANFEWGDISVKNYNGSELQIVGNVSINLHENDDAFKLDIVRENGAVKVSSGIEDWKDLPQYVTLYQNGQKIYERVGDPKNMDWNDIKSKYQDAGGSYSFGPLIEIELTLLVPEDLPLSIETEYGSLEVLDCKNPLALKAIYGHLLAEFSDRSGDEDCSLESTYSFVDITLPSDSKYNLTLQTNFGEIYSDLDFNINKEKSIDKIFESKVVAALNRGGAPLQVSAKYNNIYLRKKG